MILKLNYIIGNRSASFLERKGQNIVQTNTVQGNKYATRGKRLLANIFQSICDHSKRLKYLSGVTVYYIKLCFKV